MLSTLQRHIFVELGKNFLLTSIGLTGILSMSGGIYNLTQLEQVTPSQLLLLMSLIVPMCAAFTLPIAALFSASITYGRMASDNEFDACRGVGINIVTLFAPCIVLSLFSATVTFGFFNFLIPNLMTEVNLVARSSLKAFMAQTFQQGGSVEFKDHRVNAGEIREIKPPVDANGTQSSAIYLQDVAFIELGGASDEEDDQAEIVRSGTADSAIVKFTQRDAQPLIEANLVQVTLVDLEGAISYSEKERIGPYELPSTFRIRPRYLSLPQLFEYRHDVAGSFPQVRDKLIRTRRLLFGEAIYERYASAIKNGSEIQMSNQYADYVLGAEQSEVVQSRRDRAHVALRGVTLREITAEGAIVYRSEKANVLLDLEEPLAPEIVVDLEGQVRMLSGDGQVRPISKRLLRVGPMTPASDVNELINGPTFAMQRILDKKVEFSSNELVEKTRKRFRKDHTKYLHEIYSQVHIRSVYSLSVIVLTVLGAALAIILRGGQVLVAFGISFVPALFVILMSILGKGIAKGDGMLGIGLCVMWSGLLLVMLLDIVVFKKYLPR